MKFPELVRLLRKGERILTEEEKGAWQLSTIHLAPTIHTPGPENRFGKVDQFGKDDFSAEVTEGLLGDGMTSYRSYAESLERVLIQKFFGTGRTG